MGEGHHGIMAALEREPEISYREEGWQAAGGKDFMVSSAFLREPRAERAGLGIVQPMQ